MVRVWTSRRTLSSSSTVRFWNGKEVRGVLLLDDQGPSWDMLFLDLDQEELEWMFHNPTPICR